MNLHEASRDASSSYGATLSRRVAQPVPFFASSTLGDFFVFKQKTVTRLDAGVIPCCSYRNLETHPESALVVLPAPNLNTVYFKESLWGTTPIAPDAPTPSVAHPPRDMSRNLIPK